MAQAAGVADALLAFLPPSAGGGGSGGSGGAAAAGADFSEELKLDVVHALTQVCGGGGFRVAELRDPQPPAHRPPPAEACAAGNVAGAAPTAEALRSLARSPDSGLHRVAARGARSLVEEIVAAKRAAEVERGGGPPQGVVIGTADPDHEQRFVETGGLELLWTLASSPAMDVVAMSADCVASLAAVASFRVRRRMVLGPGLPHLLRWLAPRGPGAGGDVNLSPTDFQCLEAARISAAQALAPLLAVEESRTEALARGSAGAPAGGGHDGTLVRLLGLAADAGATSDSPPRLRRAAAKALAALAAHAACRPALARDARVVALAEASGGLTDRLESVYWGQIGAALCVVRRRA